MQTAGSGPDSPSAVIFATLPVTASGHPGNLGLTARRFGGGDIEATSMRHVLSTLSAMRSAGLVLAGALAVAGCAPEARYPLYSPLELAESFGYAEQQLSETGYRVNYSAPIRRTYAYGREKRQQQAEVRLALAYDLALWRAASLRSRTDIRRSRSRIGTTRCKWISATNTITITRSSGDVHVDKAWRGYYIPIRYIGKPPCLTTFSPANGTS